MQNKSKRILFYAINGVGLGHVARLSVIAKSIIRSLGDLKIFFYSNSPYAYDFFECEGDTFFIPNEVELNQRKSLILSSFNVAVQKYQPNIVICDTYWPIPAISILREQGIRTILIVRLISISKALSTLQTALNDFDLVIIPHLPEEILALYGNTPRIIDLLNHARVLISGPIARIAPKVSMQNSPQVLFSLGGGGEYDNPTLSNTVNSMKHKMHKISEELIKKKVKCIFARGPFLPDIKQSENWNILETLNLHEFITEQTVVVCRAGYNTCWETLAVGGRLVLVGDHVGFEDIQKRGDFLEMLGLAINTYNKPDSVSDIVYREISTGWNHSLIKSKSGVNLGIDKIIKQVITL